MIIRFEVSWSEAAPFPKWSDPSHTSSHVNPVWCIARPGRFIACGPLSPSPHTSDSQHLIVLFRMPWMHWPLPEDFSLLCPLPQQLSSLSGTRHCLHSEVVSNRIPTLTFSFRLYEASVPLFWAFLIYFLLLYVSLILCSTSTYPTRACPSWEQQFLILFLFVSPVAKNWAQERVGSPQVVTPWTVQVTLCRGPQYLHWESQASLLTFPFSVDRARQVRDLECNS